jgi:hypothetical protein
MKTQHTNSLQSARTNSTAQGQNRSQRTAGCPCGSACACSPCTCAVSCPCGPNCACADCRCNG